MLNKEVMEFKSDYISVYIMLESGEIIKQNVFMPNKDIGLSEFKSKVQDAFLNKDFLILSNKEFMIKTKSIKSIKIGEEFNIINK